MPSGSTNESVCLCLCVSCEEIRPDPTPPSHLSQAHMPLAHPALKEVTGQFASCTRGLVVMIAVRPLYFTFHVILP